MAALTAVNTPPIQPIDLLVVEDKLASSIEKAEVKSFAKAGHRTARAFGKCRMACPTGAQVAKALMAAKQALAITPDEPWVRINLAHARLLLDRTAEAKALYEHVAAIPNKP